MALVDVVDWLACPHCGEAMRLEHGSLCCAHQHTFDVARQGHVNLLSGPQPAHADTADMVARRLTFLARGHYDALVDALVTATDGAHRVVDAGAGPGWYLARLLEADGTRHGLALDISVAACRRAARAHPRLGSVVADVWATLPVRSHTVDAVTCVFAPRNMAEFARILAPGGRLVVATPGPDHLIEARTAFGLLGIEDDKAHKLASAAAPHFAPIARHRVEKTMALSSDDVADVVAMGPNAFHEHAPVAGDLAVTLQVDVTTFARH